jgi:hypothetical protein
MLWANLCGSMCSQPTKIRAWAKAGWSNSLRSSATRNVFERYTMVSWTDIADAMRKLQQSKQTTLISH